MFFAHLQSPCDMDGARRGYFFINQAIFSNVLTILSKDEPFIILF